MNVEMLLNNLLSVIYKNPNDVKIEYSNDNGIESLKINGEEQLAQFDDSRIKTIIKNFKENLELLDDCTFEKLNEKLSEDFELKEIDDLISLESFNQADANLAEDFITKANFFARGIIEDKIENLKELLKRF